ncbi:hypothetical protein [Streptomyces sp. URMC 124]|uniref:hypothetical protein n=1 Tax=Streptomyces sp. URMC 124 TaxID=3423405 RepID=UPI003F19C190
MESASAEGSGVVAAVPVQQVASWPVAVAQMLSPLSVFEPERVELCTRYRMALVDETPAAAHVDAAVHHLRAALGALGREDRQRMRGALEAVGCEVKRIAAEVGVYS